MEAFDLRYQRGYMENLIQDMMECDCESVPVMGVVAKDDPRWFGGFVDHNGLRHDPLRHGLKCSKITRCAECDKWITSDDYLCSDCREKED